MTRPVASLSFDLDNLWAYRMTHGERDWQAAPTYLPVVSDRILELLDDLRLHITFFVVGRDAADDRNGDALSALAQAGHEIGNHSFDHRPWMHRWTRDEIDDDIGRAEEAITAVTGTRPQAFRGPGYSLSERTIDVLVKRGYRYDCSTLPTYIGPLARWFYFRGADLDPSQREERRELFGSWRDGLRPIKPYKWQHDGHVLTELPLTTVPLARVPCHVSYLLTLAGYSERAADLYWRTALAAMRRSGVSPSVLLHPLDLVDAADAPGLSFFPGMGMPAERKRELVRRFLRTLSERFDVVPCGGHVDRVTRPGTALPAVSSSASAPTAPVRPLLAARRVRMKA
ncbi:MAG TPA: polysaccharide deacetylase family protein [Acidimicrobiales bacterium]